jgi:putative pyridoxal-dependent aspartate 1-decarboxylase
MEESNISQSKYLALSAFQKRLFFLNEIEKDSLAYNLPLLLKIKEKISIKKFRNSLVTLAKRHEILRTRFNVIDQVPYQIVPDAVTVEVELYERSHFFSEKHIITNFIQPFNLNKATPFRIALAKNNENEYLLLIDTHEILMDEFSQRMLVRELFEIYSGIKSGHCKVQFKDYLIQLNTADYIALKKSQKRFWIDQFKESQEKLELPLDFTRPLLKFDKGGRVSMDLDSEIFLKLKKTAQILNVRLFDVLLACFYVLLGKIGNQEDITIGTLLNERQKGNWEKVSGNLTTTLPLRIKPEGNLTFNAFLLQMASHIAACFKHNAYKYEELVEELNLDRAINRNPLFDVMFLYQQANDFDNIPEMEIEEIYQHDGNISKLDLTLKVIKYTNHLSLHFDYAIDLFKEETIVRFTGYFRKIVEAVVANIEIQISEIEILSDEEKNKLLVRFNDTFSNLPKDKTILSHFTNQVDRNPEAIALIEGDNQITYSQLNDKVERLAGFLKQSHLKKGDLVAVLTGRSPEYIYTILAIIKNQATFLPIDIAYPDERINYILNQSTASFLISNKKLTEDRAINFQGKTLFLDRSALQISAATPLKEIPKKHNESLYVIYTSGTTGFPKGAINTETGLLNRLHWGWKQYGFGEKEVCCQKTGLGFADHIAEIFSPLLKGVPLVFIEEAQITSVEGLIAAIDEKRITRIVVVPSLLKILIKRRTSGEANLESLKYVFSSGDNLTVQLANEFYKEFQTARLINVYGSSEVSADVSFYEVPRFKVAHILSYFKNLTESEKRFRYLKVSDAQNEDFFTTPNVSLTDISENFKVSKVSDRLISVDEYYRRLEEEVIPYSINTASPGFIGHMTSALPDFVHEISKLISQMNQNLVKIETSKALTLLEREAIAMLHRLFYAMPNNFYDTNVQKVNTNMGIVASGGTTANISAILAARNRVLFGNDSSNEGYKSKNVYDRLKQMGYKDMVIIGSELMHYSFKKTASLLGFGSKNIVFAPNNKDGVLSVSGLVEVIEKCKKEKLLIIAVVGIAGSTERGSIDPLVEIGEITKKYGIHFHVDAAWGGAVMFSKKYKKLLQGIERASSITICGHKQLFLPQGISVCLFRDIYYLGYNSVTANYQAQPNTFDFGRFTLEGSRPALSLCLHAAMRILGMKGYELLINNGIEKANMFASMIQSHDAFQLFSCQLNILNYRYIPKRYRNLKNKGFFTPEINEEINGINERIQQEQFFRGKTFVSKTTIKDIQNQPTLVFRTVISNPLTTRNDFVKVLNDQIAIVAAIFGEENPDYKDDLQELLMEMDYKAKQQNETSVPIGKPIDNIQILILNKYRKLQPEGVPGELYISGAGLASKYLNNEEETVKAFVKTKYINGNRLYKTGDIGRWRHDGNIEYLGRKDDQVKVQGYRIELSEIIYHLNTHEAIEQSVVISKAIENEKYLIAYYTAENEIRPSEIYNFLSERLPFYMIPSFFVFLNSFPLNANRKLDKSALPDPQIKNDYTLRKPETEIEEEIAKIWAEILKKEVKEIGTETDFFEIGGRSLFIIELTHTINARFKKQVSAKQIFLKPTIKQQALLLTSN